MLNELYTFAEPVQVVPFSNLKWGEIYFTTYITIDCHENFSVLPVQNRQCERLANAPVNLSSERSLWAELSSQL